MAYGTIQRPSEDFAKCVGCTLPFESVELDENQRCELCAAHEAMLAALDDLQARAREVTKAAQQVIDELQVSP